jgi:hypothetical protein
MMQNTTAHGRHIRVDGGKSKIKTLLTLTVGYFIIGGCQLFRTKSCIISTQLIANDLRYEISNFGQSDIYVPNPYIIRLSNDTLFMEAYYLLPYEDYNTFTIPELKFLPADSIMNGVLDISFLNMKPTVFIFRIFDLDPRMYFSHNELFNSSPERFNKFSKEHSVLIKAEVIE